MAARHEYGAFRLTRLDAESLFPFYRWYRSLYLLIVLCTVGLLLTAETMTSSEQRLGIQLFSLGYAIVGIIAFVSFEQHPLISNLFTTSAIVVAILRISAALSTSSLLVVLLVPVLLALGTFGIWGSTLTGLACLIVALPLAPHLGAQAMFLALLGIAGVYVLVLYMFLSLFNQSQWLYLYYQDAFHVVNEARDERQRLKQSLVDLDRAAQQLQGMNRLAQDLRKKAESAYSAKAEFVANVSHELRTPLNMIAGYTEMMLQSASAYGQRLPPALLADLAVIDRNVEHLSALINDVLDLSQVEANRMVLLKEDVDFSQLVEAAVTAVKPLYDTKGLTLHCDLPSNLPPIFCDPVRIRQVLLNLLSNAGRFMEAGGTTVRVTQAQSNLMVAVTDTGLGISEAELQKLFKPFQQLDGSIRRKHEGTGLGLSISKQFVELHGGEIWVESCLGAGTTFSFSLPIEPPIDAYQLSEEFRSIPDWELLEHDHSRTRSLAYRPRILIAEQGTIVERLLRRHWNGIEIERCEDLQQAQLLIRGAPYDLLIVNTLNTGAALTGLKTFLSTDSDLPIIVCSIPDIDQTARAFSVDGILIKPILRDALLNTLDKFDLRTKTVLLVDDETDALQLYTRILNHERPEWRVLRADDGLEALRVLETITPDVILMDLVMPTMDGFQFLEYRRTDPRLRTIPIILISARDPNNHPIVTQDIALVRSEGFSIAQMIQIIQKSSAIMGRGIEPAG